jgi:myo-inositol 2-dehydrogenase / D-chiro-inositol 1-dehydrogenase
MKTVRVDAVCAGATGRTHAETLKTSAVGAELVAVSDPDAARAEAVACGAAHVFANALRLIELPEVGAVVVASPDERREKQVAASIADGKPVLCEKAPASSSEAFARHS